MSVNPTTVQEMAKKQQGREEEEKRKKKMKKKAIRTGYIGDVALRWEGTPKKPQNHRTSPLRLRAFVSKALEALSAIDNGTSGRS